MALSRTARILVALLLLTAAAFFWVNFFTQNAFLVEAPTTPGVATQPAMPAPTATVPPTTGDAITDLDAEAAADAPARDVVADGAAEADAQPVDAVDAAAGAEVGAPEAGAEGVTAPAGVTAPVVVIDAPVTLSREVVVADLPFLITSPPVVAATAIEDVESATDTERRLASARATVNPFSPVVVRVAAAPAREVPTAAPVITEVAVPAEPNASANAAAPAPRVVAPTPQVRAPAGTAVRDLPRALPTGVPLAATPDLLRQPRAAAAERVDVTNVAAIRLPAPESAPPSDIAAPPRVTSAVASTLPEVLGPGQASSPTVAAVAVPSPPLAAGTNVLSRYLRDNGYTFTGSALGPVSVGVFRSHDTPTPVVVAIGQSLPDTDIVLTDLRGQQAQLTLGDTSQILVLDLRR
jgi:hypothetical protein